MKVHAQSTMTLAESRPPYIHLGYLSACPSRGFGLWDFDIFVPGVILFLVGYLIALKFNYGWLIGGIAAVLKKFGLLKILAAILSILLLFAAVFVYYFAWIFN